MIRSGHAPIQVAHLLQRPGLKKGVPFSSSSIAPKGHSSVHLLHDVQRCMKGTGQVTSHALGCTAMPFATCSADCIALRAAPVASSCASVMLIRCRTHPAA